MKKRYEVNSKEFEAMLQEHVDRIEGATLRKCKEGEAPGIYFGGEKQDFSAMKEAFDIITEMQVLGEEEFLRRHPEMVKQKV